MLRNELVEMIALAERLAAVDEPAVLATLFSSNGSTYRPLGSMMVSGPASTIAGGVSGGCLEQYVARQGRSLTMQQAAAMLSFDADPDVDDGRPVLGCGGSIEVLVERLTGDQLLFLQGMCAAHAADTFATAGCVIDTSDRSSISVRRLWLDDPLGLKCDPRLARLRQRAVAQERSRHGVLDSSRRALVHYVRPMTRLVIFGAGDDVRPLCAMARPLGWHVTVADRRARLATRLRFPDAEEVVAADWATAVKQITFTPRTAVVMMTHSLADDIEILPLLTEKPSAYIGALGPAHRRGWLLERIAATATTALPEAFAARFRGPIGLDLGDRSPAGIAVSVVSEILAELNGRAATPLSQPDDHAAAGPAPAVRRGQGQAALRLDPGQAMVANE